MGEQRPLPVVSKEMMTTCLQDRRSSSSQMPTVEPSLVGLGKSSIFKTVLHGQVYNIKSHIPSPAAYNSNRSRYER